MLTLTTALQGDALPQRQALYQLGNSLAAGEGGARDGFSHFRYIDQSQVLGYEGGGENIQVAADGCSQAVLPPVPGCAQVRLRDLVTGEEQVVGDGCSKAVLPLCPGVRSQTIHLLTFEIQK